MKHDLNANAAHKSEGKPTNARRGGESRQSDKRTQSVERGPDGIKADDQTRAWLKRMGY